MIDSGLTQTSPDTRTNFTTMFFAEEANLVGFPHDLLS